MMFLNFKVKRKKAYLFSINIILIFIILSLTFYSVSCEGKDSDAIDNGVEGKIIVGCDTTLPPFVYMEDEKVVGFDIDIATEIAERMDKELEIESIKWDCTYQFPEDLYLDMMISAIPINEEKDKLVDFSIPYFVMKYMLVALSETDVKAKEDLEGKSMGILKINRASLDEDYLLDYKMVDYEDIVLMFDDLKNKNINGVICSLPIIVGMIAENESIYTVLDTVESTREYGIVFKEGSELTEEVNSIIEEMMENGTYNNIYNKWFNYNQ
jgi:ABC-type amino acid transport substrate-binding protein